MILYEDMKTIEHAMAVADEKVAPALFLRDCTANILALKLDFFL